MKPKRLSRTIRYESPWINLYTDRVEMPSGFLIEDYHFIESKREGVAAVVENDAGGILLIQSFRYVVDAIEWEIPAGGREPNESVLETARREVLEESGYATADHQLLYSYNPMNSICDQIFHVVKCRAAELVGDFDKNEVRSVHWLPKDRVQGMIRNGQIKDGFTLTALLLHSWNNCNGKG